ncbi:GGDEF domain-containing protein [Vibrio sp. TRT 17S01]|uniref:GGDEF domain-containing protein n=1 Tax=Vibrio sp. TRT 17S01 TaxID=3418505 RepID=UPI003CE98DBC
MINTQQCLSHHSNSLIDLSHWQDAVELVAELFPNTQCHIVQQCEKHFSVVSSSQKDVNSFTLPSTELSDLYVAFLNQLPNVEIESQPNTIHLIQHSAIALPIYWSNKELFGSIVVQLSSPVTVSFEKLIKQIAHILHGDLLSLWNKHANEALILTDELTGLLNSNGFNLMGEQKLKDAPRYEQSIGLLVLDVDKLEKVSHAYGVEAADQCVVTAADVLKNVCRETDIIARIDEKTFVVLSLLNTRRELNQLSNRIFEDYNQLTKETENLSLSRISLKQTISDCFSKPTLQSLIGNASQHTPSEH